MNSRSHNFYTVIAVYKAPTCCFEDFKKHILSLSLLPLHDRLVIVGDFNFDVSHDSNRNFIEVMKSAFQNSRLLNTQSTTHKGTTLDVCFAT